MGLFLGYYCKFFCCDGMDLWILEYCCYVRLMLVELYMCSV